LKADEFKIWKTPKVSDPRAICTHQLVRHLQGGSGKVLSMVVIETINKETNLVPFFVTPIFASSSAKAYGESTFSFVEMILQGKILTPSL
jgi:hypothetical protein